MRRQPIRPVLAFTRPPDPPPPAALTAAEKYQALASVRPSALRFVNEMVEYLYDAEKRQHPDLFDRSL